MGDFNHMAKGAEQVLMPDITPKEFRFSDKQKKAKLKARKKRKMSRRNK